MAKMTAGMPIQPPARKPMRGVEERPSYTVASCHLRVSASTRSRILLRGPDDLQVSATRLVCSAYRLVDMKHSLTVTSTGASHHTAFCERGVALGCAAGDQHGFDQLPLQG
jgi:hypothetical protein